MDYTQRDKGVEGMGEGERKREGDEEHADRQ